MFQSRPGGDGMGDCPPTTTPHQSRPYSHPPSHNPPARCYPFTSQSSHRHVPQSLLPPSHPSHPPPSHSSDFTPHPVSVGDYDLPEDTYFVESPTADISHTPPPSHLPPPDTEPNLDPETAQLPNLMLLPYSEHHAHLSPFYYLKLPTFDNTEGYGQQKIYNFSTDVDVDQISLRRKLAFPYFYSPVIGRSTYNNTPILRSHIHSGDIQFPSSLTDPDAELSSHSSDHSLDLSGTENDDVIMISGSRDNHVIELPELRQPSVQISDSVLKMPPFSLPPPTHTSQSQFTTDTFGAGVVLQEMSQGFAGAQSHVTTDEQHRLDFQNGRIDYTGTDSFENIQQRLDAILVEDEEEEEEREPTAEVVEEEIIEEVIMIESSVTEETGEVGEA